MWNIFEKNIYAFRLIGIVIVVTSLVIACEDGEDEEEELIGNWIELSDFEGVARTDAVAFSIGNKGYVGTGYDGYERLSDFWEYDVERNTWTQKADFPGVPRNGAIGFATETKGYIGTGYDGVNKLKDFWEFNPDSNKWVQRADFAGSARYGAIAFSINNKGYVGTGFDGNYLKDFWQYSPETDKWEQKVSLGGSKRRDAVGFVINGKGYVCTGLNNGKYEDDFWEYSPESDTWTEKRAISNATDEEFDDEYSGLVGNNKVAFSINGKGYLATGGSGSAGSQVWEYNPSLDLWEKKTALEGAGRTNAAVFTIGSRAYVTTGNSSGVYFDDIWAFEPDTEYNEYD
jgi:N-acetylneuraminic acid mutarotase